MGNSFWVLTEKILLCKLNKEIEDAIKRFAFYIKNISRPIWKP
jgi:hypothetical protein